MCYYYDGICDILIGTEPKARKEHTCSECHLPIQIKEQYYRVESLFDGRWETFKLHLSCQDYRKMIYENEREEGCDYTESWPPISDLYETMDERLRQEEGDDLFYKRIKRNNQRIMEMRNEAPQDNK